MLLVGIAFVLAATFYLIATNDITPEERDEMLNDENIFP